MPRALVYCFVLSVFFVCGQPQTESAESERLRNQVYFTKEDPGRWKDFAKDHEPQVKMTGTTIGVDVQFNVETGHYVEVILVTDSSGREVATRSFKRGEKPQAALSIPTAKLPGALVIAKCNLHGMWKKSLP